MDFSPLHDHVCMEPSDHWLQGAVQEDSGGVGVVMDASSLSSSPSPLMESRRVRPAPPDQALKCPRCESTNTKFCYYNNYSLSQPRYFCKTCRRYWTKGGTLRNIPVGGGCRKNKKVSSTKKLLNNNNNNDIVQPDINNDLQLISAVNSNFPDHHAAMHHFPHQFGGMINNVMGDNIIGDQINYGHNAGLLLAHNFQGGFGGNMCYFDGYSNNGGGSLSTIMDSFYHGNNEGQNGGAITHDHDVKPNPKLLSLEWQDHQGCSSDINAAGKDPFGYINTTTLGSSWTGMVNGYAPSSTNPLI